jgi:hypothetical protein
MAPEEAPAASEPAVVAPEAPPARSPVVEARLRRLHERLARDVVLSAEVADFLAADAWEAEGAEAVCRVGLRWCRVSSSEVTLGHDSWPGSKRIPL